MDKPVYCVFQLIDGKSILVDKATDSLSVAKKLCRNVFHKFNKQFPVKVVESKVVHDVVFALAPPSFHVSVCVRGNGTIQHYRDEGEFLIAVRDLISDHCCFDIVTHYD